MNPEADATEAQGLTMGGPLRSKARANAAAVIMQ